jgi:hypothetical protein
VVYPNPVVDNFTIHFEQETSSPTKVVITDIAGKTIQELVVDAGTVKTQVDISTISAGNYNVSLENDQLGVRVVKIIKK